MSSNEATRLVYLLVDGENIDRTLGQILGHKPKPEQRPRWDVLKDFIEKKYQAQCRALFFLNATEGVPGNFIQMLKATKYIPIPLSGPETVKVVDEGIIRTLRALREQEADHELAPVVLASHDADFKEALVALQSRELALIGFQEYVSGDFIDGSFSNLKIYDLEDTVKAFDSKCGPLPRTRTIDISDFDPMKYLG